MKASLRQSQALHVKYVINMEMYRGKSIWAVAWIQINFRFSFNCSVSGDSEFFFSNFHYSIYYQETGPSFFVKKLKRILRQKACFIIFLFD